MFDNVIGHRRVTAALRTDLLEDRMPQAILLHGPRWAGKMTAALELARAAACTRDGAWSCPCPSCERHRLLADPFAVVVATAGNLAAEIPAALEAWVRDGSRGTRYLAFRSLRMLVRRFDPALIEHRKPRDRTQRLGETLAELLEDLDPAAGTTGAAGATDNAVAADLSNQEERQTLATSLRDTALSLLAEPDLGLAGVDVIRGIRSFLHSVPRPSTVILEDAELLQDSARNAILKILEEPPPDVRFVLLSTRPEQLIPTIRSRVRPYELGRRSQETETEVLRRIFRAVPDGSDLPGSLSAFFSHALGIDPDAIQDAVTETLKRPEAASGILPAALAQAGGGKEPFFLVLAELERAIIRRSAELGAGPLEHAVLALCERERHAVQVLNIPESLALERIGVELELGSGREHSRERAHR